MLVQVYYLGDCLVEKGINLPGENRWKKEPKFSKKSRGKWEKFVEKGNFMTSIQNFGGKNWKSGRGTNSLEIVDNVDKLVYNFESS